MRVTKMYRCIFGRLKMRGMVVKANSSSGRIKIVDTGLPDILFCQEDQYKKAKKSGGFVPVVGKDRYFPKKGKEVVVLEVAHTPDGPKAVKWMLK